MLKSSQHCALVERIPIERIITETRGPFVLSDGRRVRPHSVVTTRQCKIAAILGKSQIEMAEQIIDNLSTLERV